MSLRRALLTGVWIVFVGMATEAKGQVCGCLNCPGPLPPAGLDTCYFREFIINIKGATNDDLANPFQGICAVNVHFQHNYVWSLEMYLVSPGGDTLQLTGPALTAGYASSALSSWNISFIPDQYPANPDSGFEPTWSNDQLWEVFRKYTGQYHPAEGKLEDFDAGPVNGAWKILVKNCTEIESGNFIDFSIVFCDETGIDCSCQAYAGQFLGENPIHRCVNDPSLLLNLTPFYLAGPLDTNVYSYLFILSQAGLILSYSDTVNLSLMPAGNYEICGMAYRKDHQDSLILPDGQLTIYELKDTVFTNPPPFCGDITSTCLQVSISDPPVPVLIDTSLCAGRCYSIGENIYCETISKLDTIPSLSGCDSIISLNLTIHPAPITYIIDTICEGEFYNIGNFFYNQSGVYPQTLKVFDTGCDSIVVLDLTVVELEAKILPVPPISCLSPVIGLNALGSSGFPTDFEIAWSFTQGGNIVSGGDGLFPQVDAAGVYTLELTKTLSNGTICSSSASVTVTEDQTKPDLQGPNIMAFCEDSELILQNLPVSDIHNLSGSYSYFNTQPFVPSNSIPVPFYPSDGDSVWVYYTYGTCSDTFLLLLQASPKPFVTFIPSVHICNDDAGGIYNTLISFDTLILQSNVLGAWSNTENAPVSGQFPLINFQGVPGPISYTFSWSSFNAIAPCQNITSEIEIFVENCACPSVATLPPGPFCTDSKNVALSDYILTPESGSWTMVDVPAGSNPALLSGDSLFVQGKDAGTYRIEFKLNTTPPVGCPDTSVHSFVILTPPHADILPVDSVCNGSGSGLYPEYLHLPDLITSGDTTGTWTQITPGSIINQNDTLFFQNMPTGVYLWEYMTNTATAPCQEQVYSSAITVVDCICDTVSVVPFIELCNDQAVFSLASTILTSSSGSWQLVGIPAGSNPITISANSIQINGKDPGQYLLEFKIDNAKGGNCRSSDTLVLELVGQIGVMITSKDTVCNQSTNTGLFPTILNFDNLMLGGNAAGNWIALNQPGTSGSFPILSFNGVQPGSYDYLFVTNNATPPCANRSYPVSIVVLDCNCPEVRDTTLCLGSGNFLLDQLVSTSTFIHWTVVNVPSGGNAGILQGQTINSDIASEGTYQLRASWTNGLNSGCVDSQDIFISFVTPRQYQIQSDTLACSVPGPFGSQVISFDGLIIGDGQGGQWYDIDMSGASGVFPTLDFTGVGEGVYRFVYVLDMGNPCGIRMDTLTIQVTDCQCPPLTTPGTLFICESDSVISLESILPTSLGSWSMIDKPAGTNPAIIMNGNLLIHDKDSGFYRLRYQLNTAIDGCSDTAFLEIQLDRIAMAGDPIQGLVVCHDQTGVVLLTEWVNDSEPGGLWIPDAGNPGALTGLNAMTGALSMSGNNMPGQYTIYYIVSANGMCPADTAHLDLVVQELQKPNSGADQTLDCNNRVAVLNLLNPSVVSDHVVINWMSGGVSIGSGSSVTVTQADEYILELTDTLSGCTVRDSIHVFLGNEGPSEMEFSIQSPSCTGNNGSIVIAQVSGGVSPYLYAINGGPLSSDSVFTGLSEGFYFIRVEDVDGCQKDTIIEMKSDPIFSVHLGPDITVSEGALVTLNANIAGNVGQISNINWSPVVSSCTLCQNANGIFNETSAVWVIVVNTEGCQASDTIIINVIKEGLRYYAPTAISVNEDGINDRFTLYGNKQLEEIRYLRIFDRWGNLMFERNEFPPNDEFYGWDGRVEDKVVAPGVYVFSALIKMATGGERLLKGEVIVLR